MTSFYTAFLAVCFVLTRFRVCNYVITRFRVRVNTFYKKFYTFSCFLFFVRFSTKTEHQPPRLRAFIPYNKKRHKHGGVFSPYNRKKHKNQPEPLRGYTSKTGTPAAKPPPGKNPNRTPATAARVPWVYPPPLRTSTGNTSNPNGRLSNGCTSEKPVKNRLKNHAKIPGQTRWGSGSLRDSR